MQAFETLKRVAKAATFGIFRGPVQAGDSFVHAMPATGLETLTFCVTGEMTVHGVGFAPDPAAPFTPGQLLYASVDTLANKVVGATKDSDYVCVCPNDVTTSKISGNTLTLTAGEKVTLMNGQYLFVAKGTLDHPESPFVENDLIKATSGDALFTAVDEVMAAVFTEEGV